MHTREDGFNYGITYSNIEKVKEKNLIPIIVCDVDTALQLNAKSVEGNFLFIYPPSFEELRRRLGARIETEQ